MIGASFQLQDPTISIHQNYEWPYKMITKEEADLGKQESTHDTTAAKTTSWTRLKDPRIVRVSRAFGGKDRHSKVCTVKGLRDRRVRLSVPTAIQLYDLQDRLGLNQPSKVVDWLLHAAKNEIDELPPLQFPPGNFPMMDPKHALKNMGASISWNQSLEGKCKEVVAHDDNRDQDCSWGNQDNHFTSNNQDHHSYPSSSLPSFARWDPSNLTLSHHPSRSHQHDEWPNFNLMAPLQPSGSHHHQVLVYHGMSSTQSYFPSAQIGGANSEIEAKQLNYNNNQASASSTQPPVRQIFNMMTTANLLPSQNDETS